MKEATIKSYAISNYEPYNSIKITISKKTNRRNCSTAIQEIFSFSLEFRKMVTKRHGLEE